MGPDRLGSRADADGNGETYASIVLLGDLALDAADIFFQQGIDPFEDRGLVPVFVFFQVGNRGDEAGVLVPQLVE